MIPSQRIDQTVAIKRHNDVIGVNVDPGPDRGQEAAQTLIAMVLKTMQMGSKSRAAAPEWNEEIADGREH